MIVQGNFDTLPSRLMGVEVRKSNRWADCCLFSRYSLPYYNKLGQHTGCLAASVRCTPQQFVATNVSTILNRLSVRVKQYNDMRKVKVDWAQMSSIAFTYAYTKSNWFLSRILALLKNYKKNKKAIQGILMKFVSKFDENTRFVHGQVKYQTNWLNTRGLCPRDKSKSWKILNRSNSSTYVDPEGPIYLKNRAFRLVSVRFQMLTTHDMASTKQ